MIIWNFRLATSSKFSGQEFEEILRKLPRKQIKKCRFVQATGPVLYGSSELPKQKVCETSNTEQLLATVQKHL